MPACIELSTAAGRSDPHTYDISELASHVWEGCTRGASSIGLVLYYLLLAGPILSARSIGDVGGRSMLHGRHD